jgi:hypothetical protein
LNSKVLEFFINSISSTKQGGYYEYKPMYVSQLPIAATDKALHDKMAPSLTGCWASTRSSRTPG